MTIVLGLAQFAESGSRVRRSGVLQLDDMWLRGADVLLRPLAYGDALALADAAAESRDHYDFSPVPSGTAEAFAYVERALAQRAAGERYPLVIVQAGRVVGTTSYTDYQPWRWPEPWKTLSRSMPDSVEIGYTWLAASVQRTSCNTVAKLLLFSRAFEQWQVHSVCLRTDERNLRSRKAIERLGCKFEGIRRAHMPGADGKARNSAFYSVLASEWPAVREHIMGLLHARGISL